MRNVIVWGFVSALAVASAGAQDGDGSFTCGGGSMRSRGPDGLLGLEVVGLTDEDNQRLVCFSEFLPFLDRVIGPIGPLVTDGRIVGIDYRPATGQLYGLGDLGGVYTISASTAEATLQTRLNVALEGTFFGVDFNPTVDLLRIVSDTGQNLRANVVTGVTQEDTDLATPPTAGTTLGVTAAAYTNNDTDPLTATTLFDVNTVTDRVVIQAPPNNGSLNPTGSLRVDAATDSGFDIYSRVYGGITQDVTAFAALTVGGNARFYRVDLLTGEAKQRGFFRRSRPVVDIAIPTVQ